MSIFFFLLLTFSPLPAFSGKCNKDDKKALVAINAHFGFPYHFASWTNDSACCDWYDIDCDSNGRVIRLSVFQDTELNGTIPEAIGNLPFLQQLTFNKLPKLDWVIFPLGKKIKKVMKSKTLISIDCEMVLCEDGTDALVRVWAVDHNFEVKLDKLVKPSKVVADYRTSITGISAKDIDGVVCSLEDVQDWTF